MKSVRVGAMLALAGILAGCPWPGSTNTTSGFVSVSALLGAGGVARLVPFRTGGEQPSFNLAGGRPPFIVLSASQSVAGRAQIALAENGVASAFRLAAADEAPPAILATDFEGRLRRWERPLAQQPAPKARRRLLAAPAYAVGAQETFWVIADLVDGRSTEIQVPARADYVGDHCYVFVDRQLRTGQLGDKVEQIGKTFDAKIFPTDEKLFGTPLASGVNGDPKITILISPVVGNYGRDTTIGYFTLRDLFAPNGDAADPILRHSNQRLMLYMSPFVVSRGQPSDYLGTLAHEFQHLINASQKLFAPGGAPEKAETEDLWLDEGLAMYAMEANGYGLNGDGGVVFDHVAGYLARPQDYSLTNWDLNPQGNGYGPVYLFITYLVERFGDGILKELVASRQVGTGNVQARLATRGSSMRQAFEDWSAANLLDDTGLTADPRYAYKTLNMLGPYGRRALSGLSLERTTLPLGRRIDLKPYGTRYLALPRDFSGSFRIGLTGDGISGLLVAP